jgi:hypothetical protein
MPRKDRKPAGHTYQTPDKPQATAPVLGMVLGNLSQSEGEAIAYLKKNALWDGRRRTFKPQAICLDINDRGYHSAMLLMETRKVRSLLDATPSAAEIVFAVMGVEHRHTQIVNGPHIAAAFNRNAGKLRQKASAPVRMVSEVEAYDAARKLRGGEMLWAKFARVCAERGLTGCTSANALAQRKKAWKSAGLIK